MMSYFQKTPGPTGGAAKAVGGGGHESEGAKGRSRSYASLSRGDSNITIALPLNTPLTALLQPSQTPQSQSQSCVVSLLATSMYPCLKRPSGNLGSLRSGWWTKFTDSYTVTQMCKSSSPLLCAWARRMSSLRQ